MIWQADKGIPQFTDDSHATPGYVIVQVRYFNDAGVSFHERYTTRAVTEDWIDDAVNGRLSELNAINLALVQPGSPRNPKPIETPPEPTDEQIRATKLKQLAEALRVSDLIANGLNSVDPVIQALAEEVKK